MRGKTCPGCGAAVDDDQAGGLCPACLLDRGLQAGTAPDTIVQCGACRSTMAYDARFCARCGAPAPVVPGVEGDPVRAALEARLADQYRIVRLLGRGGMGAVYLARDLTLDREVAIKVVKTDEGAREIYDRLRREAKTAARLSHPNIVPLHAFGEVDGMPYFVMGYVRGEPLADRLRRDGKLPEDEARRVLAQVADALDHAHRQGVVHRDVKPDNVLLEDASGRALLTDFGVAKALGRGETMTSAGGVVGTPHYMSPEQAAGRSDIDARTDIYSLGVMAYAMLAGRLPFEGHTAADVLAKHLTQAPPSLRSLAPTVSDPTVQAVERCLAKDAAARWPDARSLRLAFGAIEDGQLPDAVQAIQGTGIAGAVMATAFLAFLWWTNAPAEVIAANAGVVSFLYLFALLSVRRNGLSMSQAQRVVWAEPPWWPFWYPRTLRRPGNVWDRLPAAVRQARWVLPAAGAYVASFVAVFVVLRAVVYRARIPGDVHLRLLLIELAGLAALLLVWSLLTDRAMRELKRRGLGAEDGIRVVTSVPPSRVAFWGRPHIAALLAPPEPTVLRSRSDSPHDHLQGILRHGDELAGPLRPLGAEAAVAARQLIAAIEQADRNVAELARNLEPGEEKRLLDRIEALAAAGEESAPLRHVLEKQLELIRGLSGRIEEARGARSRLAEMLKTLNLHLASLRARSAEAPEVRRLSDRVRALCDEIARQPAALATGTGIDGMATRERAREGKQGSSAG